jgi:uncharacterized protein
MRAPLLVASTLGCCLLGAASGCEKLLSIQDPVAGNGPSDSGGSDVGMDGSGPYGNLPPNSPLLLSEIVLTTVPGTPDPGEMIEIFNTSAGDVDLSTYYLSDNGNYYRLPVGATVDMTDFIVKFPEGAVIHGYKALTIAIASPTDFLSKYNQLPDYSLRDGSLQTIVINGAPALTNTGEPIVLFQWDGQSDLVRDVDIMLAGVTSGINVLPDKSNATQDGTDQDMIASKYAVDVRTMRAQPAAPGNGFSTKRIALEDVGHEIHNGTGNGQSGDDETSEDTSLTWDGTAANPFTAPTPGDAPIALRR